jgi:hypothetical protein
MMADEDNSGEMRPDPATRASRGAPQPPRPNVDRTMATLTGRNTFIALQLGASALAVVGGVVVFVFLVGLRLNSIVALVLGFGFALLARRAATYLALEWLVRQTRQRDTGPADTPSPRDSTRPRS